ncbi:MAG: YdcH family protein [Rhodospirillaceae bacterium]|nr:YdcH family protein [Rhodospirillaceae bacterium]
MSMQDRIEALRTRHQEIETALDDATSHFDDDISVHELKKQKLAIKDEIAQLEAEL